MLNAAKVLMTRFGWPGRAGGERPDHRSTTGRAGQEGRGSATAVAGGALVAMLLLGLAGCESTGLAVDQVLVSGSVVDANSGTALSDAMVRIVNTDPQAVTQTDAGGDYELTVDLTASQDLVVVASKQGYVQDTTEVVAIPGENVTVPEFRLSAEGEGGAPPTSTRTGPMSVILSALTQDWILVKESGGPEVTDLVFEVRDSSGYPMNLDNSVDVTFKFGAAPGGGETLFPMRVTTNGNGKATTSLHSGTAAGVVQVVAEVSYNGTVIRSHPASVAIHGGLPDSAHFGIGVERFNMPFVDFGATNAITAIAGDKYGNVATPGTAVYFSTTGGIIEGSALTDSKGGATVDLISNNPYPQHPVLGPGYAVITAQTADENNATIEVQALVLMSGHSTISGVSPTSFNIANGGSQSFSFTVSDEFGNPLTEGTHIEVTVDVNSVTLAGDVDVTLDDVMVGGAGITQFGFTVSDADAAVTDAVPVTITIKVTGDNGTATYQITGTAA